MCAQTVLSGSGGVVKRGVYQYPLGWEPKVPPFYLVRGSHGQKSVARLEVNSPSQKGFGYDQGGGGSGEDGTQPSDGVGKFGNFELEGF